MTSGLHQCFSITIIIVMDGGNCITIDVIVRMLLLSECCYCIIFVIVLFSIILKMLMLLLIIFIIVIAVDCICIVGVVSVVLVF